MKLSKNYSLSEFEHSDTAKAKGINNTAPPEVVKNLQALVSKLLQPISDATGWVNIITSGYRSPKVNELVGGSSTSQHLIGSASDNNFYLRNTDGTRGKKISTYDAASKVLQLGLDFDQMILYPNFLHLSYKAKGKNRKQVLYNKAYTGPKLLINK